MIQTNQLLSGRTLRNALEYLETTGNPYFAWEAYQTCRKHNLSIPDRILNYLGGVAEELLEPEEKPSGNKPWAIDALGMLPRPGTNTYFDRYLIDKYRDWIVEDIASVLADMSGLYDDMDGYEPDADIGDHDKYTDRAIEIVLSKLEDDDSSYLTAKMLARWYKDHGQAARETLNQLKSTKP